MRYEDWDILLFPRGCEVPLKEFKVACTVVHDHEFSHTHGSFGIPTLCCWVPSLPAGTPFQISIHSWAVPTISQFAKTYSGYPDSVKFEARLFIDGRLVASASLDRNSCWPHVIAHSFDFSKNGDLESLKFPVFQQELLQQNHWSPADDLGRIKLIISEGFPRDSLSMPIERVKNVVAFTFQHAPLEILEGSSIAWPNPSMWRRPQYIAAMPVPPHSTENSKFHAHSPRRRPPGLPAVSGVTAMPTVQGVMSEISGNASSRNPGSIDCPVEGPPGLGGPCMFPDTNAYFEWLGSMNMGMGDAAPSFIPTASKSRKSRKSSTDISMPDYASSAYGSQMPFSGGTPFAMASFQHEDDLNMAHLKVPSNTPTGPQSVYESEGIPFPIIPQDSGISTDLANTLTNSLLNQTTPFQLRTPGTAAPMAEPRSRKEARTHRLASAALPSHSPSTKVHLYDRNWSQQLRVSSRGVVPSSLLASQVKGPKDLTFSEVNQRTSSMGKFGADLANLVGQENILDAHGLSDKGNKRGRNYTPESAKTIEEEDEPRRASPRIRLTPFAEGSPTAQSS
ncbi:hypothetical protein B0J13DRAFT_673958 [Dactylonectria estremocensis]|uniref:NADH dehydrogenase (Ubiquinone)-like protein n=1 Tax=Dactylonectria estremocensis TaxID=1079267 RepID=A0A9P9F316_9HYPO|nr:hypothetical protein B0J13DRAFT_673958 [Dactylonectria estremocensis]